MAIYELWIERTSDNRYIGHYDRVPPEKKDASFGTAQQDSPMAAAHALRAQLRTVMGFNDQLRVRDRINIYENVNDALEDMMRS